MDAQIPKIERVEFSAAALEAFTSEDEFNELAVKLGVEFGSWVCVSASLLPGAERGWNRHESVLAGHLVRFYKLVSGILDQTCQHRREMAFIFGRLAFECVTNIQYLVKTNSPEVYDSYIAYSLRHEKRLQAKILENIKLRGGEILPIEQRMLSSIAASFETSGLASEQITKQMMERWKNVDLYQRAKQVGLDEAYLGMFAGPSHSVHGNWQDLIEYHLVSKENGFFPQLEWRHPRPQLLGTIIILGLETLMIYLEHAFEEASHHIDPNLEDLLERAYTFNRGHENFISARMTKNHG